MNSNLFGKYYWGVFGKYYLGNKKMNSQRKFSIFPWSGYGRGGGREVRRNGICLRSI
jgi:hypothetical protein